VIALYGVGLLLAGSRGRSPRCSPTRRTRTTSGCGARRLRRPPSATSRAPTRRRSARSCCRRGGRRRGDGRTGAAIAIRGFSSPAETIFYPSFRTPRAASAAARARRPRT
jgi:hypothetical protein